MNWVGVGDRMLECTMLYRLSPNGFSIWILLRQTFDIEVYYMSSHLITHVCSRAEYVTLYQTGSKIC